MTRERGQRGLGSLSSEDQPGVGRGGGRLLPLDWPFAVRAGAESVLAGWLLVVIPTLAVFVATSSRDAAAALSLGSVLRTGTALWGLGLGGSVGSPTDPDGVLALPLLGVTLAQAWVTDHALRRARLTGPVSGAWAVGTALLTSLLLVLLAGPAGGGALPAVLGSAALTLAVTAWRLQREGRGSRRLAAAWRGRPRWVDPALALGRLTLRGVAALVVIVAVLAVVTGVHRLTRLYGVVGTGGILSWLGLLLLQLAWLPTALVWALSWLAGPGFVVGTGTVFAPAGVVAGAVPSLPLLGLLPTDAVAHVGLAVPLLLSLVALAAVWLRRRDLAALALPEALIAAVAASVAVTLLVLVACLLASGAIGPGRMADVGPRSAPVAGLVLLEVGAAMLAGTAVVHPWTRRATEHGVVHTSAAASTARERVSARIDDARLRRAGLRREREEVRRAAPADTAATGEPPTAASPESSPAPSAEPVLEQPDEGEARRPRQERSVRPTRTGRPGTTPGRGRAPRAATVPERSAAADTVDAAAAPEEEPPRFTAWRARLADRLDRDEAGLRPRPATTSGPMTNETTDDPREERDDRDG